jgi:predicted TIM-barrel fold metal-dependent hydrolase
VRQILNWHDEPRFRVAARPDLMTSADWRRGYARLRRFGFSFDLQIYWPQMGDARRLAADFPDTTIVLDHFGMPIDRSVDGLSSWRASLTRLAEAPNVQVKLSGLGLGNPLWSLDDTTPILKETIDIFGVARCMLGTNLPVERLFGPPGKTFEAFHALSLGLSEHERDAIYRSNAQRVYRL